ncbi:helix-turn-helix domain-containing protein [Microbacterium telephonicum]|uniref:Purine catabolism regulator n=1 Tax=Microbacterium telephonicum TaxID=1714841 RepID=A0A498CB17_9MICO|nr:PucR family transcriptional regulator [Microbacterium telephonicum]RLK52875.1 purine catabolism regulator [Microbacterium telephonicum]
MTDPAPTLRSLLTRRDLGLTLALPESDLTEGALDAPLRWVHSSDLADPTPFLADDLLLLTTGTQFDGAADAEHTGYVERLRQRGVRGLGFGTEVVRDGIPPALLAACRDTRMPLFEVPYRTPFIALARANAEAIAAEAFARRTWALSAQRALSLAALRPDGLSATVAELAKQLETWVGLYDAAGMRTHQAGALPPEMLAAVGEEVGTVLRRGARAGSTLERGGIRFTLQTLGRGGHLRGAIVIAGGGLDLEGRGVVTSVIAMAGLALEQNVGLDRAYAALRAALVQSLLTGEPALARRVAREVWGALPTAPVTVSVARVPSTRSDAASGWLELQAAEARGTVFHGRGPEGLVVISSEGSVVPRILATLFDAEVGVSRAAPYSALDAAHAQAVAALRRSTSGEAVDFDDVAATGVLASLDTADARARADAHLRPLRDHDAAHGTALVETVRVWLQHDARIDAAAAALGVHRHTVRARVSQAQTLLGVDLAAFPARAELWAALIAAR